jgi:hypothetical protein
MQSLNFDSFYKQYANQTLQWLQTDSEESYKKNYNQLKNCNWIDKDITYQFNSLGFRCNEFTNDPSIMFLGCSFTCGIGLPLENIWPELVAKEFRMNCANLGIGGGAADTAFRLCLGYIDKIKPKAVVYLPPPGVRIEIEIDNKLVPINVYSYKCNDYNILVRQFFKLWLIGETNNDYFNRTKNSLAIKQLCSERNIPFIQLSMDNFPNLDWARDLAHDGIESNHTFAKHAINEIKKITNW